MNNGLVVGCFVGQLTGYGWCQAGCATKVMKGNYTEGKLTALGDPHSQFHGGIQRARENEHFYIACKTTRSLLVVSIYIVHIYIHTLPAAEYS